MSVDVIWIGWLVLFLVYEVYAALSTPKGDTLSEATWRWFGIKGPKRHPARRVVLAAFMLALTSHFVLGTSSAPIIGCGVLMVATIAWSVWKDRVA